MAVLAGAGGFWLSAAAAAMPAAAGSGSQAAEGATAMQPFTSHDGRFSVLLPGIPEQETDPINLPGGATADLNQFWVVLDDDHVTYMVMYSDYRPEDVKDGPEKVLERARAGAGKDRTLVSESATSLDGVPGQALTLKDRDGWLYTVRQYLKGTRLYQLVVVSDQAHPAKLAEEFLGSFKMF